MCDDDYDWYDYESGPYCEHWYEIWECEEECATCGHMCKSHDDGDDCDQGFCTCQKFVDLPEEVREPTVKEQVEATPEPEHSIAVDDSHGVYARYVGVKNE